MNKTHTFEDVDVPHFCGEQIVLDNDFEYGAFLHVTAVNGKNLLEVRLLADKINPNDFRVEMDGCKAILKKESGLEELNDQTGSFDRYTWLINPMRQGHFTLAGEGDALKVSWTPYKGGFRIVNNSGIEITLIDNQIKVLGEEKLNELRALMRRCQDELDKGFSLEVMDMMHSLYDMRAEVSKGIE